MINLQSILSAKGFLVHLQATAMQVFFETTTVPKFIVLGEHHEQIFRAYL